MNFFSNIVSTFRQQGKLAQIIIINVAVFLVCNVSLHILHLPQVGAYLALPIGVEFIYKPWTLLTYMFTHYSLGHIFFNLILFYFSAQLYYLIFGEKKLFYLYIMSGLCGAALLLIIGVFFPTYFGGGFLLGSSASVLGIIMVMAIYTPNFEVNLFGLFTMPYKYFALLVFIVSTVLDFSINTGGKLAHIGGSAFGLIYGLNLKRGTDFFNFSFLKRKHKMKIVSKHSSTVNFETQHFTINEHRMNELLDKISKSGYESLSQKEKDELFHLSQKK
ncbi:MAG: rhomboid family intramembrane serine protease [Bacteroidetes bacterium]|nr:rhomboid family intramembrane serine protease [Bacteroidota bacterium]